MIIRKDGSVNQFLNDGDADFPDTLLLLSGGSWGFMSSFSRHWDWQCSGVVFTDGSWENSEIFHGASLLSISKSKRSYFLSSLDFCDTLTSRNTLLSHLYAP